MNLGLAGKRFAIAGATSALGRAIATLLDREGARLLLIGRDPQKLATLVSTLSGSSSHTTGLADMEIDPDGNTNVILQDAKKSGPLSGGVYCPGIVQLVPLRGLATSIIERVLRVNFVGAQMFAKALASRNVRNPSGGSIVFIASVAGMQGEKGLSAYGASKAALISSARTFARELADLRIRVNCVSASHFDSPMADSFIGGHEEINKNQPLGLGTPNDVAGAVTYLLSDVAKWVTGMNMVVDGGYMA